MPPPLATLFCIFFILFLFWAERADDDGVSRAIWIPFFWMFLAGSRFASQWLNIFGISAGPTGDVYMEGSPIDMPVFLFLIAASLVILFRRRLNWDEIFQNNYIVWAFYIFALISVLWSDYPFISFKRWLKTVGAMSMVLVILT